MADFQDYSGLVAVTEALKAAGIPFSGLSVIPAPPGSVPDWINEAGGALKIIVNFLSSATAKQRTQAADIVITTNKAKRTPKTDQKLRMDVEGLSNSQQKTLLNELLAERLRNDPLFAVRLNVPLSGDDT